jgi:hypothetical protein
MRRLAALLLLTAGLCFGFYALVRVGEGRGFYLYLGAAALCVVSALILALVSRARRDK